MYRIEENKTKNTFYSVLCIICTSEVINWYRSCSRVLIVSLCFNHRVLTFWPSYRLQSLKLFYSLRFDVMGDRNYSLSKRVRWKLFGNPDNEFRVSKTAIFIFNLSLGLSLFFILNFSLYPPFHYVHSSIF